MSSSKADEIPLPTLIDLIKSNARALYGRHLTYDVITTSPKRPGLKSLAPTKFDGQKVHALLVGYDDATGGAKGTFLRGAYSVGAGRNAPTVGDAVRFLFDELRMDVGGFVGRLVMESDFEGGLMRERGLGLGEVDDDEIDGITLRGDGGMREGGVEMG